MYGRRRHSRAIHKDCDLEYLTEVAVLADTDQHVQGVFIARLEEASQL